MGKRHATEKGKQFPKEMGSFWRRNSFSAKKNHVFKILDDSAVTEIIYCNKRYTRCTVE
jgi:hypothetical protein